MLSSYIPHLHYVWLVTASLIAGVMNAMAGGGSFLSFPAMLGMGVMPVQANATNTVALWPGQLTSLATLRGDVRKELLPAVVGTSIVGALVGAEVLLHTRQQTFSRLIPWLILGGTLIFGASGPVSKWIRSRAEHPHAVKPIPFVPLCLCLFPVCFYIGYFGAGGGFVVMTVLALFGDGRHAPVECDEGGGGVHVEPGGDCDVRGDGECGVALLPDCDGVCGGGRVHWSEVGEAHEPCGVAGDCGDYRVRDCGLFFLEAGTGMTIVQQISTWSAMCAATLTTISFLPQLIRVVKLRSARDISLGMFLIFTAGTLGWLVYGWLSHSAPVWIANAVTLALSLSILVLKLRFDRHATEAHPAGAPR